MQLIVKVYKDATISSENDSIPSAIFHFKKNGSGKGIQYS